MTGIEVPRDERGDPVPPSALEATFKRVWYSELPEAKYGEFSVADLDGYVKLVAMLTQHLAALSRTPPHYLLGQIANASGDALKRPKRRWCRRSARKWWISLRRGRT